MWKTGVLAQLPCWGGRGWLPDLPEQLVAEEAGIGFSVAWTLRLVVRALWNGGRWRASPWSPKLPVTWEWRKCSEN